MYKCMPYFNSSRNGDVWTIINKMGDHEKKIVFKFGEEFEEDIIPGVAGKSIIR